MGWKGCYVIYICYEITVYELCFRRGNIICYLARIDVLFSAILTCTIYYQSSFTSIWWSHSVARYFVKTIHCMQIRFRLFSMNCWIYTWKDNGSVNFCFSQSIPQKQMDNTWGHGASFYSCYKPHVVWLHYEWQSWNPSISACVFNAESLIYSFCSCGSKCITDIP